METKKRLKVTFDLIPHFLQHSLLRKSPENSKTLSDNRILSYHRQLLLQKPGHNGRTKTRDFTAEEKEELVA